MYFLVLMLAGLLAMFPLPARAQQSVTLQFNGGQVTLSVQNVPTRVILAEWARIGGVTIVNGDHVAGAPVTLELTNVSERQALDIVLRSVAGYMLAPRRAGSGGASAFDRIVILPTSVAPRTPPAVASGAQPVMPRPAGIERPPGAGLASIDAGQGDVDLADEQEPAAINQPPRPGGDRRIIRPPVVMRPPVQQGTESLDPGDTGDDAAEQGAAVPGVAPTPTNPFGIPFGSSATPGVVTPAPQPQRPPGANGVQ